MRAFLLGWVRRLSEVSEEARASRRLGTVLKATFVGKLLKIKSLRPGRSYQLESCQGGQ